MKDDTLYIFNNKGNGKGEGIENVIDLKTEYHKKRRIWKSSKWIK